MSARLSPKPTREEFGAGEASLEHLRQSMLRYKPEWGIGKEPIYPGLIAGIIATILIWDRDEVSVWAIVITGPFTLLLMIFVSFLGASLLMRIAAHLYSLYFKVVRPRDYVRLTRELEKRQRFEDALNEWIWWNSRSGEGFWLGLKGISLEKQVRTMFLARGWPTNLTPASGDGGIDLEAEINQRQILVQCKGYAKPLGVGAIRDAAGVRAVNPGAEMWVICPSGFTRPSRDFAHSANIKLLDANALTDIANGKRER